MTPPLLALENVSVVFRDRRAKTEVHAVRDVSLALAPGETLGVVGGSGSGKSTLARAVMRLVDIERGRILFHGEPVHDRRGRRLRHLRRNAQMIFQDPGGSLDPRMRVRDILTEPLDIHRIGSARDRRARAARLAERCGLPADALERRPEAFSGGQRQRIAIARALMLEPDLLVCDEPTSALDVSVQAQILNLLRDVQREESIALLFISHDIGVVDHLADRVAVMHEGRVVETGPREQVLGRPEHPYTKRLIAAVPRIPGREADARREPPLIETFDPRESPAASRPGRPEPESS